MKNARYRSAPSPLCVQAYPLRAFHSYHDDRAFFVHWVRVLADCTSIGESFGDGGFTCARLARDTKMTILCAYIMYDLSLILIQKDSSVLRGERWAFLMRAREG